MNRIAAFFSLDQQAKTSIHFSCLNDCALLVIRTIGFLYMTGIYIWLITTSETKLQNFLYLTQLGFYFTWLFFCLVCQGQLLNKLGHPNKKLDNCIGLLYEVSIAIQLPITVVFWAVLFPLIISIQDISTSLIALNVNLHVGPILFLIIDLVFNCVQFPYKHFRLCLIIALVYLIINLVYSLLVKPIYPPIDWVTFMSYLLCFLSAFLAFLMHLICRLIFAKLKKKKLPQEQDYNEVGRSNNPQIINQGTEKGITSETLKANKEIVK